MNELQHYQEHREGAREARGTVIAVTSGKAGVGKSTVVANLACCLAQMGNKVCVVDANFGMRSMDLYLGLENRIVCDWLDVIEGRAQLYKAVIKARNLNLEEFLHLLPTSGIPAHIEQAAQVDILEVMDELHKVYDYILIDSPSLVEHGFENIIQYADRLLLVTTPNVSSLRDTDRLIGYLGDEQDLMFVLNKYNPRLIRDKTMRIEEVSRTLAITMAGVVLDDDDTLLAGQLGRPIAVNKSALNAIAFQNIARRITGEDVILFQSIEKQVKKRGRKGLFSFI